MPTMNENLTPAQRAANFKAVTRQNIQSLAPVTATPDSPHFEFTLPKARFLAKLYLKISATNVTMPRDYVPDSSEFLYNLLRNVTVNMNTGFRPFSISGDALYQYNRIHKRTIFRMDTATEVMISIPFTLNDTDPVGLILLQNNETVVTVSGEIESGTGAIVTITPVLETFTIPSAKEAYPSLSILKLVNSRQEIMIPQSENIFRLSTGTIYRKILMRFYDSVGQPVDLGENDTIQLVFNQADTPYNIPASCLRWMNLEQAATTTYDEYNRYPAGFYFFDFATADITNHLGSRDLIDTERLTEFWVKVNSSVDAVKCVITTECLTRVQ